ncbi:hypothetical protein [Streptomyces calvus]|uniref:hypothetical protein n=1 Tax=Streptomyces calvus TaxID=67282 RepID=UPI00371EB999
MARTPRRHPSRTAGVAVVATALALTAAPAAAVASPDTGERAAVGVPAGTTPPPTPTPSPTPTPTPTPTSTPGDPQTSPPSDTTGPQTSPPTDSDDTTGPDGTPETGQTSGPGEQPDRTEPDAVTEQREEAEAVTAQLNRMAARAPDELKPSVAQLTSVLERSQAPETSPQDRDGIIGCAGHVAAALEAINAPGTPAAAREQLTDIVQQVASGLDAVSDTGVPEEQRAMTVLTLQGSASVLELIADPGTPQQLRDLLAGGTGSLNTAAARPSPGEKAAPSGPPGRSRGHQRTLITAYGTITRSDTSGGDRQNLAGTAGEAAESLDKSTDPRVSQEDRDRAQKKLAEQIDRLQRQLEKIAATQGLPDVPLGKAAEVCANAAFSYVPEPKLIGFLAHLTPDKWNGEGVKDYWKSRQSGDGSLDVQAQLKNNSFDRAPFGIARLVPELADFIPARQLFGTLGMPGLHCLRSAVLLDEQGVRAGTWVDKGQELA